MGGLRNPACNAHYTPECVCVVLGFTYSVTRLASLTNWSSGTRQTLQGETEMLNQKLILLSFTSFQNKHHIVLYSLFKASDVSMDLISDLIFFCSEIINLNIP